METALCALLSSKLRAAIEYSDGYGLDGTSPVSGVPIGTHLVSNDEKEESYESLDLPALTGDEENIPTPRATTTPPLVDEPTILESPANLPIRLEDSNGVEKREIAEEQNAEEYEEEYEWEEEETVD